MAQGFRCDADNTEDVVDYPFGRMFLDLNQLPEQQALVLMVNLAEKGLIDVSDPRRFAAVRALQEGKSYDYDLPEVEIHLCAGHALTALGAVGIVNPEKDPADAVEEVVEGDQQA